MAISPHAAIPCAASPEPVPTAPSPLYVALACALAAGTAMYDQTSLVVVAPTVAADLGADLSGLQWLTALFALVASSAMPVSGLLGRRLGARTTLQIGLVLLILGAVLAATASSMAILLVARAVQGVGGALVLPNAPALLGGNVTDPVRRAHTVGIWMTMATSGVVLGPLFGGLLAEHLGWRATFVAYLPIAIAALLLLGRLENTKRERSGSLDIAGLALASAMLAIVSWSLITAGRGLGQMSHVAIGFTVAVVLFVAFIAVERRVAHPLLDLDVFGNRAVRLILLASFSYNAIINGTAILLSVHFQETRGMTALETGLLMLTANIGMPLSGFVVSRLRRVLSNLQMMALALAVLSFAYLSLGLASSVPMAFLVLPLLSIGVGCGLTFFVDTNIMLDHVQGPASSPAMATLALMRQIGTVVGIATFASLGQLGVELGLHTRPEPLALTLAGLGLLAMTAASLRWMLRAR